MGPGEGLFSQAIQSDSTYLRAYIRLGLVHLYQKDPHKGFAVLTRALELDPGTSRFSVFWARPNLLKKQPARADVSLPLPWTWIPPR